MAGYEKFAESIPWKFMGPPTTTSELGKSLLPVGNLPFRPMSKEETQGRLLGVPATDPSYKNYVVDIIGTAFQGGDAKLVTCAHVAEPLSKQHQPAAIARIIRDGQIVYVPYKILADIRYVDPRTMKSNSGVDLAVLLVPAVSTQDVPYEVPIVNWGDSESIGVGDCVCVGGYPLGTQLFFMNSNNQGIMQPTFYEGIISAIYAATNESETRIFQISTPVCGGISGGVMFKPDDGKVYGMVTSSIDNNGSPLPMTYVIPSEVIKPFVDMISMDTTGGRRG